MVVLDDRRVIEAVDEVKDETAERMADISEAQKAELKRLSKEARGAGKKRKRRAVSRRGC